MREWWYDLDTEQRSWFIISGMLALFVVSLTVGIVTCMIPGLLALTNVGFGVAFASLLTLFATCMIRFA